MNGKRTTLLIITELHLWCVVTSLALDKIADGGVFYDHTRPERVPGETEEIGALIGGNFNHNIGPTSQNMLGFEDFFFGHGSSDDLVEWI